MLRRAFWVFRVPFVRAIALALVAVAVIGSPAPQDTANEATLAQLYPGERIDFTGVYEVAPSPRLVRFAITCCRADARPVSLPLARALSLRGWVRLRGVVVRIHGELAVETDDARGIAPPSDPFIYR